MSINYAKEYYMHKKEQDELRKYYLSLGMSDEKINELFEFDDMVFCSNNRFKYHNQYIETIRCNKNNEADGDGLVNKFRDNFVYFQDFSDLDSLYWINEIEDPEIYQCVKSLSKTELVVLTLVLIKQAYTQKEMAKLIGVSQQEISRKIKNICEAIRNCKNDL